MSREIAELPYTKSHVRKSGEPPSGKEPAGVVLGFNKQTVFVFACLFACFSECFKTLFKDLFSGLASPHKYWLSRLTTPTWMAKHPYMDGQTPLHGWPNLTTWMAKLDYMEGQTLLHKKSCWKVRRTPVRQKAGGGFGF